MAITFPSPGGQTPSNTFSPTSSPAQTTNGLTYVYNPTLGAWISTSAGSSAPVAATLAEAAAGTLNTVFLSPQTGVPKDASGMTGAAILPSGTDLQRAAITGLTAGMTRFNTDYSPNSLETYDGANWNQLAYVPDLGTLTDLIPANGSTLPAAGTYENIIINAGVTVNVPSTCSLKARSSVQINGTIAAQGVGSLGGAGGSANPSESRSGELGQGLGTTKRNYGFATSYVGSGGTSGSVSAGAATGIVGGSGGNSGGTLILECQGPITVGASAIINASGQNGQFGSASGVNYAVGGAGGGSGGLIVLQSLDSLTLTAGASLAVNGGNGSNGIVSGTSTSAGGGGGGGGGYIVLNSPSISDASSKNLVGGTGGSTVVTGAAIGGGIGAGFGGAGGLGSNSAANGSAGSTGQVILNAYI